MPNQRHPDQMLTAFSLDRDLADAMDSARLIEGLNRSEFIRRAIGEKLKALGIDVTEDMLRAPDRARRASSRSRPSAKKNT